MLIRRRPSWAIPESQATPESLFHRRSALKTGGLAAIGAVIVASCGQNDSNAAPAPAKGPQTSGAAASGDPSASLYPFKRNPAYTLGDKPLTDEKISTSFNNYYEFGTDKGDPIANAQKFPIRPWAVSFEGMVEKPIQTDIDTLIKAMPLEERLYRHRCVEAWSMAVPWSGFPMKALVDYAKPTSGAKYVTMTSFMDRNDAVGQRQPFWPWPYTEGLTMAEAMNDLSFMVTGMYGKPLPKQNGSPLRLAVPWKYGFKSTKGIVRFTFTDKQPKTFWEGLASDEYGFWANVNPAVPHPRWSQATEEVIGTGNRVPTTIFNGYGAQVASLYPDLKNPVYFR
jgi:sulfoxide reductase catalytic subunit YedY